MSTAIYPSPRSELVTGPTTEPVTIHQAKKHLEIATSDTFHDDHIYRLIRSSREQFEHDTDQILVKQRLKIVLPMPQEFRFPQRPVSAIVSVSYYDTANVSQTLSSSVYQLDTARHAFRLAYNQSWPDAIDRWDAFTVTYTAGSHDDSTTVPAIAQQAILLLVGHYFENRDMIGSQNGTLHAYESLVARYIRSSYP